VFFCPALRQMVEGGLRSDNAISAHPFHLSVYLPHGKAFMERAAGARPGHEVSKPRGVIARRVNPRNGLLYKRGSNRGREELFRTDALPRRNRFWRRDREAPVIR